eukprot:6765059-Alexandrium_andersonii.AAC.1
MCIRDRPGPTAREVHDAENEQAVGGMRLPHLSLRHVPRAAHFSDLVRPVLLEHLRSAPGLDAYLR